MEIVKKTLSTEASFSSELWKGISKKGKRFVARCLEKDPELRLSGEACLEHPWLKGKTSSSNLSNAQKRLKDNDGTKGIMKRWLSKLRRKDEE